MGFTELLLLAKNSDNDAIGLLFEMYRPLLAKESHIEQLFDEDLYQILNKTFLICIKTIEIKK